MESEHDFGRRQTSIRNRIVNFPLTYLIMESINETIIEAQVVEALRTCFDPEIPVNIYELGMIYDIDVKSGGQVDVTMTLTSPSCPAAQIIPVEVKEKSEMVKGVNEVNVHVVWEPRWDPAMMSEEARLTLGM